MESLYEQTQREDLGERLWGAVCGWGDKKLVNYLYQKLPIMFLKDFTEEVESIPKENLETRNAVIEGRRRATLLQRLEEADKILNYDKDRLFKEMSIEMQIAALEEFVTHLEKSGEEICKSWRPKLVSINVGMNPNKEARHKVAIFGYFKTDITKEELEACYKAYQADNDWEYECDIPEDSIWRLDTELAEHPDSISKNAGWTRYLVGYLS